MLDSFLSVCEGQSLIPGAGKRAVGFPGGISILTLSWWASSQLTELLLERLKGEGTEFKASISNRGNLRLNWAVVAAHHVRDTLLTLQVSLSHSQGHFRCPRTLSSHIGSHVRALRWRCLGSPKASC